MGAQFGKWNFDGQSVSRDLLHAVSRITTKFAPDSHSFSLRGPVGMLYRALNTTEESCHESQPLLSPSGVMLTWDGRLDNRKDLTQQLSCWAADLHTDADIVMAAYKQWGTDCLPMLVGDWALAIWNPIEQTLTLAKDFMGLRQLYYSIERHSVTWSTALEPLVLLAGRSFKINEEWVAGYLSTYPATHLTPYEGISAVRAGAVVQITPQKETTYNYFSFDPNCKICYRTDAEYEEHFRSVFAQAVDRRIQRGQPVLAELSGGIDSASIVCMADQLVKARDVEYQQVDTISYFDDREPNWNERPYFELVEQKRGREGYHVDVGSVGGYLQQPRANLFMPLPGSDQLSINLEERILECLSASRSRVLLSGIGGDEFLGGVPTAKPEIQDLFIQLQWLRLGKQLKQWSLQKRVPWVHLLFSCLEDFFPEIFRRIYKQQRIGPWLEESFLKRNIESFWADSRRVTLAGPLPSFQASVNTMNHLRRQFSCSLPSLVGCYEYYYPFLDRDLLEFLFSIPRDQLVRPGQRRSLMRRALAGIVPGEILSRKRKAYIVRYPIIAMSYAWNDIKSLLASSAGVAYGWFRLRDLAGSLVDAKEGKVDMITPLLRLLKLELWIQSLASRGLVCISKGSGVPNSSNTRNVNMEVPATQMTH